MSAERTPASLSLVEPLLDLAGELLGRPVLPTSVEARLLLGQSGMHTDVGFDIAGVNLVAYFDRLRGPNGALRVLPGTRHQPCRETDSSRCARTPSTLPG